ncbi:MAG TPA: cupin domain-containing protein [Hyphomicrobiaceae bacterium]|nr:cupin domain-containing protein [Hyphomicrobiaceae bacterium]
MAGGLRLVRGRDLEPYWGVLRAREPGFQRSLITWMGGPEGYINTNPAVAVESRHCAVGLMDMGPGNRQPGVHTHTMTEIYVILEGECESFDGVGNTHVAGPLDCLYIPKGVPHGVRTLGDRPLKLLWVNDAIERWGVSVYAEGPGPHPGAGEVGLIRYRDIAAGQSGGGVSSGRKDVAWVAGGAAPPPGAVRNDRVALGLSILPAGAEIREPAAERDRLLVCIAGQGRLVPGTGAEAFGPEDAIHCPAGVALALRAEKQAPLSLVWIEEID